MAPPFFIGVTGSIACGKTRVCSWFKQKGFPIIDADAITHQLYTQGDAYNEICTYFEPILGDSLYVESKDIWPRSINRGKLGNYIFSHPEAKLALESILHPRIRRRIILDAILYILKGHSWIIFEIPLLYESGLNSWMDTVIVVACSEQRQLDRLLKRSPQLTYDQAKNRIRSQKPLGEKILMADIVLDNDGEWEYTEKRLEEIVSNRFGIRMITWLARASLILSFIILVVMLIIWLMYQ
jgi:dephospho-CoA kinase